MIQFLNLKINFLEKIFKLHQLMANAKDKSSDDNHKDNNNDNDD